MPLVALIIGLGVGGYFLTSTTIRNDRDDAAERRARVEAVGAQEVLGRARAYVAGLAEVLANEPQPSQDQFARWATATSASIGLNDVLWVERVDSSERERYERERGYPITRLTPSGQSVRAPAAPSYFPAAFTSQTRPELRPGVDVTSFPALGAALRDRSRIFAVGASRPGALEDEKGFYLLQVSNFASGPRSHGYLIAFVPRGWFSTTLGGDPRRVGISEDGQRIEGQLGSVRARAGFEMLGRRWRVDVAREPRSGLQSTLPWLALAWPFAVAGVALAIGRAVTQRRRAQRDMDRIFDLSTDLIAIVDLDGRYRAVNQAFLRTLGYSSTQVIGHQFAEFLHPDDLEPAGATFAEILSGADVNDFDTRFITSDGLERWLQWSARYVPDQGFVNGIARDVTDARRRAAEQAALRHVATLVAEEVPAGELFVGVTRELGSLFGVDFAGMIRFDDESSVSVVATWAADGAHPPVPERWELETGDPAALVAEAGRPVRVEDWSAVPGPIAAIVREQLGARSSVGCPIVVEGRLWGAIAVHSKKAGALPPETEERIAQFADLVATAMANAEARSEVTRLADEQAALRRVATLVAEGTHAAELFAAVTREVAGVFRAVEPTVNPTIIRFDPGPEFVLVGEAEPMYDLPIGSRWPPKDLYVSTRVCRTGRSAHVDKEEVEADPGPDGELLRRQGIHYQVGSPIVVEGQPWGAMTMNASNALPPDTGERLESFTELLATAIANAEARGEVERLAQEQTALRRVATLVAREAPRAELFAVIADECARMFGTEDIGMVRFENDEQRVVANSGAFREFFPLGMRSPLVGDNAASRVYRTGQPARIDEYESATGPIADAARSAGARSAVAVPIIVEGRLWGAMVAASHTDVALPEETELRLGQFTDLMATAIANTQARADVKRLADEQASLRHVAELVAREAPETVVISKVTDEVVKTIGPVDCCLWRDEGDGSATLVAVAGAGPAARSELGRRQVTDGDSVVGRVLREGRPARIADYATAAGSSGEYARSLGVHTSVACPVAVGGSTWGAMQVLAYDHEPLPADTEARLERFSDLVATAISNSQARGEVERLAEEQAALRRVATLVAEAAPPSAVFSAVVEEVGRILGVDRSAMTRFDDEENVTVVASWRASGEPLGFELPRQYPAGPMTRLIRETGKPVRLAPYPGDPSAAELEGDMRSSVAAPITVRGSLWGFITAAQMGDVEPPADTEVRLRDFTELVATAIANTETRTELERLAQEQGALRQSATLIAEGAAPAAVFDAVVDDVQRVLEADQVSLLRYEPGSDATIVARVPKTAELPFGTRPHLEGDSLMSRVQQTGRPARMDSYEGVEGPIAATARSSGMPPGVAAPVVVEGRLWGAILVRWQRDEPPPPDTEERLARFAELLEIAIANADGRDQLNASRARLVTEADDARRRVVRDLHDGAQQRLVHSIITLKLAQRALRGKDGEAVSLVDEALAQAEQGNAELRELAHGILPSVLTRGGLRAGIDTVVARLEIPVDVDIGDQRFPAEIEATAYFIVAEALTNVVKHSHAARAEVMARAADGLLHVEVRDDGVGGADVRGHGLVGLSDRAAALGGQLSVESRKSGGTRVSARLPLTTS